MVAEAVSAMLMLDLKPGDRVASYSSNSIVRHVSLVAGWS